MMRKFDVDYEEQKRQILHAVEANLNENKAKMIAEMKEKRFGETTEEAQAKRQIDELLNKINTNLDGLKRCTHSLTQRTSIESS